MTRSIRRFWSNTSGNMVMLLGLAAAPMLAATGAAIDYSRSSNTRSAVASAADAAALIGAKTPGDASARELAARKVFESNLRTAGYYGEVNVRYINITSSGRNTGYRVEANATVKQMLGSFLGTGEQGVKAVAQASSGLEDPTEIVFVLDTTDSMEGDRIANLKSATNGVLDEIARRNPPAGLIKYGVVPFAQYVNVGMGNRNAPWIDVRPDYQTPVTTSCSMRTVRIGDTNCRSVNFPAEPPTPATPCMRDGRPRMCGGNGGRGPRTETVCDPVMSATPQNVCDNSGGDWVRWEGCVGSRAYPLETMDARYDVRIPGILGTSCATPLLPLTTDAVQARSTINALITTGETYLPSGLIWGWRMLSPGEPLSAGAPSAGTRKFMILVTDGRNTKSPNYPDHEGSDSAMADRLTRETCNNIAADRANGIRVFTIAFEVDSLSVKPILNDCAVKTGGQFFDATNAEKLRLAFSQVLDSIFTVKLTQ